MSNLAKPPVRYELRTPDLNAAQIFYGTVLGWRFVEETTTYRNAIADQDVVAGLAPCRQDMEPPAWRFCVDVNAIDPTVERIMAHGGAVCIPSDVSAMPHPALLAQDPFGATFYILQTNAWMPSAFAADRSGYGAWHRLDTPDQTRAAAFYTSLFGWNIPHMLSMGEKGDYAYWAAGDETIGGMTTAATSSCWTCFFFVEDIYASADRLRRAGGEIERGPAPIPHGGLFLTAIDPQGISFGLVGPNTLSAA